MSTDDRVEALEIKVAHLERALQDLSDVLYRQQQRLDATEAHYARLVDRLAAADAPPPIDPAHERPPHY